MNFKHGRQCLNEHKRWSMNPPIASHGYMFPKPLHFLTASKYQWNLEVLGQVLWSTPLSLQT